MRSSTSLTLIVCAFAMLSISGRGLFGQVESAPEADEKISESFFLEEVYPILREAECHLCHNDNGVASDTGLEFPADGSAEERLAVFGLQLVDLVDRENPDDSLLWLKPTNRVGHEGEERIDQGSDAEATLRRWIQYLAELSEEELQAAKERVATASSLRINPLQVRRLTHSQYNHTVRDLLGDRSLPANQFPKEDFVRGFRNQVESQNISPLQAEAYSKAAERLAVAAFRGGDRQGLLKQSPTSTNDYACATDFVQAFVSKAFRRPLEAQESERYVKLLLAEAEAANDFFAGCRLVVETALQSPHFLFRIERGPSSDYRQFELASRLSYMLWDTMPSDGLLQAAGEGVLDTPGQIESMVRQMLRDERAHAALEEFLSQWLRFDRVLTATRDGRQFNQFNATVAAAMVEETTRLFNHLVWQDHDFMQFYTADYTFLNSELAQLYQMEPPAEDFGRTSYPASSGRSGVLGHGSFLVATSKPAETSPTERGLFVRNVFLSQEVPAPPPGVSTTLPESSPDQPMTNRQRLAIHLNSDACSGCHRLIDPIGLGFEQYDPVGAFSEKMSVPGSDGEAILLALDTSASVQGIQNSEFATPKGLGAVLASSEISQRAIVKQYFRYALGRQENAADQPVIDQMFRDFRDSGFHFRELIVSLATSQLFLQNDGS